MKEDKSIAVVGMGGIFPGAADVEQFWENIISGVDACAAVPAQRWIAPVDAMVSSRFKPDTALCDRAGLISDFKFDVDDWPFEPDFLRALDPLYHLVLNAGKEAVTDCRLHTADKRRTGTILAAIALPTDAASTFTRKTFGRLFEQKLLGDTRVSDSPALSRNDCRAATVTSLPAALLAKAFGLKGGSYTLDAACASSLYAIKLACDELKAGRTDIMLAGGVSRPECLYTQVGFSQLRALSPSGRCAPFDAAADGLVVGEGAGILVLKRLKDAIDQQDTIHAVIRGIGLSNDMRGNLLAPDTEGQLRAMRAAYAQAGWKPEDIDLIECHGAGTPVGDATEINSMVTLWKDSAWTPGQCAIGSIKSMTGHLLTAAGAAGTIKTLLALRNRILPPSLHFSTPPGSSPLTGSPFHVQRKPESWEKNGRSGPGRAAVSAFGFGGINAHMLLEQWVSPGNSPDGAAEIQPAMEVTGSPEKKAFPVAVVGMETLFGRIDSLEKFKDLLFTGGSAITKRPKQRWRGADSIVFQQTGLRDVPGAFLDSLSIRTGEFRIPPAEIPDILLQHLLMLKAARGALADAGMPVRLERPAMGVIIGMEFDCEATEFHLRWNLVNRVETWRRHLGLPPENPADTGKWLDDLKTAMGPPLTAPRTLGALGGIIASRIAREFCFGGPSFVVSQDAASGLKALEIGVRSLQKQETRAMLIGAVDLPGDLRRVIATAKLSTMSTDGTLRPFDRASSGTLPGEGAAALVLKRLDQAMADNDRIYAVISGIGTAGADTAAYTRSFEKALHESGCRPNNICLIETHGSGCPREDRAEARALDALFKNSGDMEKKIAIGATKQVIGHTGAVSGLASVVKTGLCLFHKTLAPFSLKKRQGETLLTSPFFHFPERKAQWRPSDKNRPLIAIAGAMTLDGECMHITLEEPPDPAAGKPSGKQAGREQTAPKGALLTLTAGGPPPEPPLPEGAGGTGADTAFRKQRPVTPAAETGNPAAVSETGPAAGGMDRISTTILETLKETMASTDRAHNEFLELSKQATEDYARAFSLQTRLMESLAASGYDADEKNTGDSGPPDTDRGKPERDTPAPGEPVAFSREMCLEFAVGSVAKMLGPDFAVVDGYKSRVRLPDEPLMLVDRILRVEGKKLSLGSGRVVTEHDVLPDAWYLDGRRVPVCISVEAGQADLFLSGYLGIDHAVKGARNYRLLDARVQFYRGLPRPGDTIRYDIRIEKFIRQKETYIFFFNFQGFIGDELLITMTDGCAGFFTPEEVKNSGGIILTEEEMQPATGKLPENWSPPVPMAIERYSDRQIDALRKGDLESCFGTLFKGKTLSESLRLPGGRMHLIDRVAELDPHGGRHGIGSIQARADIHPDDWFLTCHFMDDRVMPGTLMYECCAHALRIFLLRMGWITDQPGARWEPVPGVKSILKCRGPVTPATRQVRYTVELKEIGYNPEPYVIADAHMHADGEYIVLFRDMSLKLSGCNADTIETAWKDSNGLGKQGPVLFNRDKILAFCSGKPSEAFGEPYRVFDSERKIARLPRPPYFFMDRVIKTEPPPWELKPGGWIEAQYDLPSDEWYFRADRSGSLPFCILLEIALQPCGWLAAYLGSALRSNQDLKFRNLGGKATLYKTLFPESRTLTMRSRLSRVSEAGDMIIEHFDFQVLCGGEMIYSGATYFGFFSKQALANQVGIRGVEERRYTPAEKPPGAKPVFEFPAARPLTPDDDTTDQGPGMAMPSTALCMLDRIELYEAAGGPHGLGFIRGTKTVDPDEWFFRAHFYQDPVIPGSLGIESFLQLVKFAALERWPELVRSHRFELAADDPHEWIYRGQVIPENRLVTVEAVITRVDNKPVPAIYADGFLQVDGIYIYEMKNFGVKLVPL